jgi:tripartite-type tricarboxylate transporter receptor subunit TctC
VNVKAEVEVMRAGQSSFVTFIAIVTLALSNQQSTAQAPVGKAVRIVVPNPPGGPADILARLLADQIGRSYGPTMVVENRPGASSDIGTEVVARAAPDGNTLLITNNNLVITKHIRPSVAFDPMTSFEPLCMLVKVPLVVVVNSSSPFGSLSELLSAAKARPGTLTVGAFGPASSPHIVEESLKRIAQVDWTYVPFPGDAPAVTALLGEHVTGLVAAYSGVMEQVKSGSFRALATTGRERIATLPEVPTVAQYGATTGVLSGFRDFDVSAWLGLFAPAHTPRDVTAHLSALFLSALQVPELKAKLLSQGLYPDNTCGPDFADRLKNEFDYYGHVIHEAKIGAQQ